jgi:A/G-specific adenine glycosylase
VHLGEELPRVKKAKLQRKVLNWFRQFQRDLPWRKTRDPYRIWISEIMLQQTRVAAVIRYYERFLARFPDVRSLAEAPEEEVLRVWSGLGYYSRARNLQKAAQQIVAKHGGQFPRSPGEALELAGIGAYTAPAILSIAYGEKLAVLDGNVARVLARLAAVRGDLREPKRWRALQGMADRQLAAEVPGDWNQAMMELGATICTPRAPQCLLCPVAQFCEARKQGLADRIPEKRIKRSPVAVKLAAAVLVDSAGRTLLLPPPENDGLARASDHIPTLVSRMWHFPTTTTRSGGSESGDLGRFVKKTLGERAVRSAKLAGAGTVKHTVTFRNITVEVFLVSVRKLFVSNGTRVLPLDDLSLVPISNLTRKVARAALLALTTSEH